MRRIAGSILLVIAAALVVNLVAGSAAAGKMESPEPTVKSTVRGQYEISRSGEVVGVEDFIRTTFSNNVVVVETVYEVFEKDSVTSLARFTVWSSKPS